MRAFKRNHLTSVTDRLGITLTVGDVIGIHRQRRNRHACIARIRDSGFVVDWISGRGRHHRTVEPLHEFGVWCRCWVCLRWMETGDAYLARRLAECGMLPEWARTGA